MSRLRQLQNRYGSVSLSARRLPLLSALFLLLAASPSRAESPGTEEAPDQAMVREQDGLQAAPRQTALEAFVWNTSPVAFRTGMVFGGGLDFRALGNSGLFVGGRLAYGSTSEATAQWNLTHRHGVAAINGGYEQRVGAGLVRGALGLGAMGIHQQGQRQQYERLKRAGIGDLERDGWSFGPFAYVELGASVVFYDPWRVFVQLGPGFTVQMVSGSAASRWLLHSGLGVGRAF